MSAPIRIVAVDDEPLALDRLTDLLANVAGVELVGALRSGREAVDAVRDLRPDLLLLDIEMPRVDGFDVVEALMRHDWSDQDSVPLICFVTAYPQYASDAFETGALDFLCKPVRLARLEKAIGRARAALDQREAAGRLADLSEQLEELRRARVPAEDRSIWVQQRGELVRLDIAALDWIEAEGEYVRLHAGDTSYLLRSSMTAACDELAGRGLIRIHRSFAMSTQRLRAVRRSRSGMKVVMDTGVELPVGRKFRKAVEDQLAI